MVESLANWFISVLGGIPPELIIFIISMVPILELRGGLIAAAVLGVNYVPALIICLIGNALPIPFILWLIKPIFDWMRKRKLLRPLVEKLEAKSTGSKSEQIRKYQFWGLMCFVGIPLPGTGGWTGALIAALLDLDIKKASLAIALGIFLAAMIMSIITYLIPFLISAV